MGEATMHYGFLILRRGSVNNLIPSMLFLDQVALILMVYDQKGALSIEGVLVLVLSSIVNSKILVAIRYFSYLQICISKIFKYVNFYN